VLRSIKNEGVDDSQYLHSLTYVELGEDNLRTIPDADVERLRTITTALEYIDAQRSVPEAKMRNALTAEQFEEYVASFDMDISHAERDETDDMPWQLRDYCELIRDGDRYTRIANLFQRARKRDSSGKTARQRYLDKAEGCYEEAVMDLCNWLELDPKRNPMPDHNLAFEIQRWLDRDVSTKDGEGPDIEQQGVPRLRGSKSKYAQMDAKPVIGTRLRKHWRQREALSKAALELIYDEPKEDPEQQRVVSRKLREILDRMDEDGEII
jgi:hypothetical protein